MATSRPCQRKAEVVAHTEAEFVVHNIAEAVTGAGHQERLRLYTLGLVEYGAGQAARLRTGYPKGFPSYGSGSGVMYGPRRVIHLAKLAFEQWWLWRWF
jgi:hypothetical protein